MSDNPTNIVLVARRALATTLDRRPEDLDGATALVDIGLDSLDFWTVLMDVEDEVGAEVPASVLDGLAQLSPEATLAEVLAVLGTWEPSRAEMDGSPG